MNTKQTKLVLFLAILVFSFAYRLALLTYNTYPSGADIGLHESTLSSILRGKTDFFYNYYHMGGGLSITNPAYHIFTAYVTAFTGAPDYVAHVLVVALFSAMTVLCAFLVVRRVWSENAAFIAALLAAFSAGDIAILSWAGYPNIVTLLLIPVVLYLMLQNGRFRAREFLAVASLLVAALFLTHVFSAFVFGAIVVLAVVANAILSKKTSFSNRQAAAWLAPFGLGAVVVSTYLVQALPVYFGGEGAITGGVSEMKQAVLETRLIPVEVLLLSLVPVSLFFVLSKYYKGKFFTVQSVVFSVWVLVPAVLTQSQLLGVYLDYERFVYFLSLPVTVFVALMIESGSNLIATAASRLNRRVHGRFREVKDSRGFLYAALLSALLLGSLFLIPFFTMPDAAFAEVDSYQVMTQPGYEALQWIKTYTPRDSVFVADADFGWWLAGFAQRPTLSAVDPQYLILAHEFEPARVASNLLQTDYGVDNGVLQVRNSGGVSNELWAELNASAFPYEFFSFSDAQTSIIYSAGNATTQLRLVELPVTDIAVVNDSDRPLFHVTRENQQLIFTQEITVTLGTRFAQVSLNLQGKTDDVLFSWLHFPYKSRGAPMEYANSLATVDSNLRVASQIVLPQNQLGTDVTMQENPDFYELVFRLNGSPMSQALFYVGYSQYTAIGGNQTSSLQTLIAQNTQNYNKPTVNLPLGVFNYQVAMEKWNISYVAIRGSELVPRFAEDQSFSLVFKNSEVSVFRVNRLDMLG
jgi:hypothetical protein